MVKGLWHEDRLDKLLSSLKSARREGKGDERYQSMLGPTLVQNLQVLHFCDTGIDLLNSSMLWNMREQLLFSLPTTSSGRYGVKRMLNWERMVIPQHHPSSLWELSTYFEILCNAQIWC